MSGFVIPAIIGLGIALSVIWLLLPQEDDEHDPF